MRGESQLLDTLATLRNSVAGHTRLVQADAAVGRSRNSRARKVTSEVSFVPQLGCSHTVLVPRKLTGSQFVTILLCLRQPTTTAPDHRHAWPLIASLTSGRS